MDRSKKECPFNKKLACEDCRLFRTELRLVGLEQNQETVSDCVFHLIRDELMVQHQRIHAMQAEMGETKNANIFQALAMIGDERGVNELKRMIFRHFPSAEIKKQLKL